MNIKDHYMLLPHDVSGSISKNRFRVELLWGIGKAIDLYNILDDFTIVFDYACDIEVHYSGGFEFYQVKSHRGVFNYTCKKLTKVNGKGSILGKLYTLKKNDDEINTKLAIVSNGYFKLCDSGEELFEYCLNALPDSQKSELEKALKNELELNDIDLADVFFIHTDINLKDPTNEIVGKIVRNFKQIKKCEPVNPNALYRLIYDAVEEKACYEYACEDYSSVICNKGLTKTDLNRFLDIHVKNSRTGIMQVEVYIDSLEDIKLKRKYKKALPRVLKALCDSKSLRMIEKDIGCFLVEYQGDIPNIEYGIDLLGIHFHNKFPVEYSNEEKIVVYIITLYRYTEGVYDETDI